MIAKPEIGTPAGTPMDGTVADQGWYWDAYIQMPIKEGQDFHYTCEFDSLDRAAIVRNRYLAGRAAAIVGKDESLEPYCRRPRTVSRYGAAMSTTTTMATSTRTSSPVRDCNAMRKVFEARGLTITVTPDRESIQARLLQGEPIFFKSTVDMMPWRPAVWHSNTGEDWPIVLTNDHALIVMEFQ